MLADSQSDAEASLDDYPPAIGAIESGSISSGVTGSGDSEIAQTAVPVAKAGEVVWVAVYSTSLEEVTSNVALIRRQIIIAGGIALVASLLAAYLAAGSHARRLRRLEAAAEDVAQGNFSVPIPVESDDEVGQLAKTLDTMQVRLARLDSARREFIANASHELRTPIASLGGFLELLEDDEPDEESRKEFLRTMRGQVERLEKLTADLLDLSRIDADALALRSERLDLIEIAGEAAEEFAAVASRAGTSIVVGEAGGRETACQSRSHEDAADHAYPHRQRDQAHSNGDDDHHHNAHEPRDDLDLRRRRRPRNRRRRPRADLRPLPHRRPRRRLRPRPGDLARAGAADGRRPDRPARHEGGHLHPDPADGGRSALMASPKPSAGPGRTIRPRPTFAVAIAALVAAALLFARRLRRRRVDARRPASATAPRPPRPRPRTRAAATSGSATSAPRTSTRTPRPASSRSARSSATSTRSGGGGGQGSGFVISDDGEIVTNAHVVTDAEQGGGAAAADGEINAADEVFVEFPDRNQVEAEIVGFDPNADVALLKVDPDGLDLRPLELGDSAAVEVGTPVAAIGSPFGQEQSLSTGIVSATDRSIDSLTAFAIDGAIQTDASINPGNSGGPLIDADGKVIGINQQINTTSGGNEGVGFAVPANLVQRSIEDLRPDGEVEYAFIGVSTIPLYPQLAERLDVDAADRRADRQDDSRAAPPPTPGSRAPATRRSSSRARRSRSAAT